MFRHPGLPDRLRHCRPLHEFPGVEGHHPGQGHLRPAVQRHREVLHRRPPHQPRFFTGSASDPGDIGVVVFPTPIQGITPAPLPPAGFLGQLGPRGLKDQTFIQVGYGVSAPLIGGGSPPQPDPSSAGTRRVATETFDALTPTTLYLSAVNDGTPCTGDSGSPQFLGRTIVAEGIYGDKACAALTAGYRLDSPSARAFLAHYVSLP
jgi:hypothetical protein